MVAALRAAERGGATEAAERRPTMGRKRGRRRGRRRAGPAPAAKRRGGARGPRVSERVARMLVEAARRVAADREACARDPARDFLRERKLGLLRLLLLLATWGQDTVGG